MFCVIILPDADTPPSAPPHPALALLALAPFASDVSASAIASGCSSSTITPLL